MLANDFEERLRSTFDGGTRAQQREKAGQMRPLLRIAPLIRRHPAAWRAFQAESDEGAWDAHLLQLGQHLSALHRAREDRGLARFCCEKGDARVGCGCDGCDYVEQLASVERLHRDHNREAIAGTPEVWMRLGSLFHAGWLRRKGNG